MEISPNHASLGEEKGGSKFTSDSLAIVMGHLLLFYHLFGSFWGTIIGHELPINDRMSVSHSV